MNLALDATAIIAHLDASDSHAGAMLELLGAVPDAELLAHPLTIAECLVVAVREERGPAMVEAIRDMGVRSVEFDDDSPMRLATLRVETRLRMPDCCALDVARHHGATLVTFDERQAKAATKLGQAVEPSVR